MGGAALRSIEKAQTEFLNNWKDKFNGLLETVENVRHGLASVAGGIAQNLGGIKANLDMNSDAMEQLDIFNQIWAKMFVLLLEQIETIRLQGDPSVTREFIQARAKEGFADFFNHTKALVLEERIAYIKEMREKIAQEQAAQQTAQESAQKEADMAESTLRGAETALSNAGGEGGAIPDGAEVFGG